MNLIKKIKLIRDGDEFETPSPPSPPSAETPPSPPPTTPPRRNIPPPPSPSPKRYFNEEQIGRNMNDSLGFLGLKPNASEREVVVVCRKLAWKCHPDKNDPSLTGLNAAQATAYFQLLNNAFSYVRENKNML